MGAERKLQANGVNCSMKSTSDLGVLYALTFMKSTLGIFSSLIMRFFLQFHTF
jgi:hypothetical protein